MSGTPAFFETPAQWRAWLEAHHATAREISVGFWKVGSGKPSITWPESVDEALAFGWIDAVRHRIDDAAYRIRFTPRKPGGIWSAVNLKRFAELKAQGRITPAGQAAHDDGRRRTGVYSFERAASDFSPEQAEAFKANAKAWAFFQAQPPGYRKLSIHRVQQAKAPAIQAKRLALLIDASAQSRRMASATQMEPQ